VESSKYPVTGCGNPFFGRRRLLRSPFSGIREFYSRPLSGQVDLVAAHHVSTRSALNLRPTRTLNRCSGLPCRSGS
jgi:hypothetical protein